MYELFVAAPPAPRLSPFHHRGAAPFMTTAIRVAQYVRMSTEHQQYSTENQADVILEYAAKHHMEIVRTFEDAGKSGLRIEGRNALKELIDTVVSGRADF